MHQPAQALPAAGFFTPGRRHNRRHYERQYLWHPVYCYQFWRIPRPGNWLRGGWLPPGPGADGGGHPARPGPPPPRHQPPRHPAARGRPGGDPLRRLRGRDHRHPDWAVDSQHRPAQQGLQHHCAKLSPRPRRLCVLEQIRRARPARRRALFGAAHRSHGGRGCRGEKNGSSNSLVRKFVPA